MESRRAVDCRIDASERAAVTIAFSLINFKLVPARCSHHGPIRFRFRQCVRACIYVLSVRGCEGSAPKPPVRPLHCTTEYTECTGR